MNSKLFVIYHEITEPINSDVYQSFAVGKDVDSFPCQFLKDNVGENISNFNNFYNELTGIYWVFKNIDNFKDVDNFGFVHYRRFFIFNKYNKFIKVEKNINRDLINVTNKQIESILKDHDFIVPYVNHTKSVAAHYNKAHPNFDIGKIRNIIKAKKPEYNDAAQRYLFGKQEFLYNMFVFSKEIFIKYCEFIFPILEEVLKTNKNKDRLYISERLTGIFVTYLIEQGKKPCYLPVLFVRNKNLKKGFNQYKKNKENHKEYGLVYKLKPIWLNLLPVKLEEYLRNRTRRKDYDKTL